MIFKRYRFQLVGRMVVLVASAFLLSYLVGWTDQFYSPLAVGLAIVVQIVSLVRYAEKAPRDIVHFLESIRQEDFTQGVVTGKRGPLFDQLGVAYLDVMAEFRRVRGEKEEHFRYLQTVVQHIGIALISYRADGQVELFNTAAKRLLGRGQLRNVWDLSAWSSSFVEVLFELGTGQQTVIKVLHEDRELQLVVYVTRFRLREEAHALVSIQDIRHELEEKEMDAWQKLTRVLTHEMMNSAAPIASLAATANRLLQREITHEAAEGGSDTLDEEVIQDTREALEAIERRSEALVHFADSYRSFTKIPKPSFSIFSVQSLFGLVHRLLRVQAGEQGIAFHTYVEPPNLELIADNELLEQVLINLLLNAMDAIGYQQNARLDLHAKIDRYGHPVVQVIDNGPGIPPELQERIFVPFFTTKEEGSGIGLSLSRQIMRVHGGTLSVRSEPDVETVFTLRF